MGYRMKGFSGFGNSPAKQMSDKELAQRSKEIGRSKALDEAGEKLVSKEMDKSKVGGKGAYTEDANATRKAKRRSTTQDVHSRPRKTLKKNLKQRRQSGETKGPNWMQRTFGPKSKLTSYVGAKELQETGVTTQTSKKNYEKGVDVIPIEKKIQMKVNKRKDKVNDKNN
jgi:hypothetical protein